MVFGEPVYNIEQRRAILQQFKDYVDKRRKKKDLPSWDEVIKRQEEEEEKIKNLSKIKKRRRKITKRRTRRKISLQKLRKLLCDDRYFK